MATAKSNRGETNADAGKKEALKEKYAEFRLAAAQVKQLQEQLEEVEERRQEREESSESLSQFKMVKKGAKILVPITGGMFATATLESTDKLLVNVGSNVCVKKTVEESVGMLKARIQEFMGFQERMLEELSRLTDEADRLEKELGQMLQEEEKG